MPKCTQSAAVRKPAKPHPDFPLFAHAAGVWAKKVKQRLHYFGPWADPEGAEAAAAGAAPAEAAKKEAPKKESGKKESGKKDAGKK